MRFATVLCLCILLGVSAGSAAADKYEPNEKSWSYDPMAFRSDSPEQEPNDACPGPQALQCGDRIVCGSYGAGSDDDWYRIFLMGGTAVTIGTDACQGSNVDTYLEFYDSTCVTRLVYDDDGGPGYFSLISNYIVPATGWYNIKTFSYLHLYAGDYILYVPCGFPPPPDPNDTCNPDYDIVCSSGVLNGDMTSDFNNYDPLSGGCATGYPEAGKDVAYRMDLLGGWVVDLTYYTPNFDAAFYIVTDCNDVPGTCVVGADAAYDTETIHYTVPATGTYWLILDHYGTDTGGGPWTLNYSILGCDLPMGACCIDGRCTITTEPNCGGQWLGPGYPTCDPNPCPWTPVRERSWGRIKATYRAGTW
jgi:hypothetical protein